MTWGNPPPIVPTIARPGKVINPEDIAGDSESSQQKALFIWAAQNVGKYSCLAYMFAVPNGFYGSAEQKGKMKAEGLRNGVPDVMLPYAWSAEQHGVGSYHGLFIEMKVKKNKADPEQIKYIDYLRSAGYYVAICYGWEQARDTIIAYLEGKC